MRYVNCPILRTKKLIVENNAKAEEIIPKINASIDSIKDLIENINEMNEKVATIAATSEEISSQDILCTEYGR